MRVSIRDYNVLASVEPMDVLVYLRWLNWKEIDRETGRLSIWAPPSSSPTTAARVPLSKTFGDYGIRVREVIEAVESFTGKNQLEILDEITNGNNDIVEVKKDTPLVENGTVPIREAQKLVQYGYDLLMAGASSAATMQPAYFGKKPNEASQYMDDVRMGQTKRGSFILTFLSPVPPAQFDGDGRNTADSSTPFTRKVTEVLARSINTVQQIAQEAQRTKDIAVFREGIKEGISANLCEAVVGLQERAGGGAVSFEFDWSKGRPRPTTVNNVTIISADLAPILKNAASLLRTQWSGRTIVKGFILSLGRQEWDQEGGWTVIHANLNGRFTPVRCRLNREEVSEAAEAFDQYIPVEMSGILQPGGRVWTLNGLEDFRLLGPDEFDAGESSDFILDQLSPPSPDSTTLTLPLFDP